MCFAARTVRQETDVPGAVREALYRYPKPMWLT